MSEQPPRRRAPRTESRLEQAANAYTLADMAAVKALHAGTASAEQQQRALNWILKSACALPDWPYVVGDVEQTHIHLGRHLVGQLIMKLVQGNLGAIRRSEPNADMHEPQQ